MESILTSPEAVKVLGFWGILIALVLWVFKELIVNMPVGNMTSEHKYKLLKLIVSILGGMGFLFSVASFFFQYQKSLSDRIIQPEIYSKIHLIVYNDDADDRDPSVKLLEEHFEKVSNRIHIKINKNYLNKQSNVLTFLQNFKCEFNDVIFFIVHGRGVNQSDSLSTYYFPYFSDYTQTKFSHNSLQKLLKEKQPRLLVMFYATSNYTRTSGGNPVPNVNSFFNENEFAVNKQNDVDIYNKLYLYSTGTISLCSASLGGWSWQTSVEGDCFVNKFISTFENYEYRESWKQLLLYAREQTYLSLKQKNIVPICYPYFEGNVIYRLPK